uniref:VPS35 endosomal protein-sorting factor-like n=1 Tax=Sinocyclocheilus rhinocerous TaxID=307959 RepID=A0A673HS76_9TELE
MAHHFVSNFTREVSNKSKITFRNAKLLRIRVFHQLSGERHIMHMRWDTSSVMYPGVIRCFGSFNIKTPSPRRPSGLCPSSDCPRFCPLNPNFIYVCVLYRHSRTRKYESELHMCRLEVLAVEFSEYHPLKAITVTDSKSRRGGRKGSTSSSSSSSSSVAPDPLSSMLDGTDPLSLFAAVSETPTLPHSISAGKEEEVGSDFEPWSSKRGEILSRFTTTEKLSINLFMGSDKSKASSPSSAVSEKVRTRLEELDDLEEGSQRELLNLSQQDYVNRIEELNQSLKEAWGSDQKVKALKIVIQCRKKKILHQNFVCQCSKLLSDTSVIQFYPSKFVLITDILDTFGGLVYDRIWSMCADPHPLPESFSADDVNDTAKETCLNWFFKIASIRELVPRLYVEAALLKCNRFLTKSGIQETLQRLTAMIRGIGDPLVAVYARVYLCRVLLTEMMDRCKKLGNNALLLNSVMWAFRAEFVATRATDFIGMIKDCDEAGFPKHLLFASLGRSLSVADPPESERLSILNEAWKVITKVRSPRDYINCAEIWVEFTCRHFTKREVNTVLADIIKHITPDRAFEDAYPQLQSVIKKILTYFHDFSGLFSMEKFLPFLDMFQKDSVRVEVCKSIMEVFIKHQQEPTRDPVILNALLHICKTMHDSVNALMLDDEKRALSLLINGFIRMVSFGRDFEQQLSFCVEARATFCNLEPVIIQLIHACAAYSFITIPSLTSIFSRLNLYLLSGQVALANQCLSQADAFLKAAVSLLPEVPRTISIEGKQRSSEPFLLDFINNFLSTLLVVPDHPEQGVLYLVRGLLNMVQDYTWEDNSDTKIRVYISALPLLAAMGQESYLYTIPKVDSNETLYGGDPKFIAEINKLCETLISQVLDHLKGLGRDEGVRRQGSLAFSLSGCLLAHGDLRNNKLNQLVVNLWNLSHKHGFCDTRTSVRTLEYIKHQAQQADMSHLSDVTARLSLQSRA